MGLQKVLWNHIKGIEFDEMVIMDNAKILPTIPTIGELRRIRVSTLEVDS